MNQEPETTSPKPGEHLQYLLTAYLFNNISAAGRREVESHLENCAQCRKALDNLRGTLGELEAALDDGGREYVFEERRRQRVLEAAAMRPDERSLRRRARVAWGLVGLAAMFMLVVVGSMALPLVKVQDQLRKNGGGVYRGDGAMASKPASESKSYYFNDNNEVYKSEPKKESRWSTEATQGTVPESKTNSEHARYADLKDIKAFEAAEAGIDSALQDGTRHQFGMGVPSDPQKPAPAKRPAPAAEPASPPAATPVPEPAVSGALAVETKPRAPAGTNGAPPSQNRPLAENAPPALIDPAVKDSRVPPDSVEKAALDDHYETTTLKRDGAHKALDKSVTRGASLNDVAGGGGTTPSADRSLGAGQEAGAVTGSSEHDLSTFGSRNGGSRRVIVNRHAGAKAADSPFAPAPVEDSGRTDLAIAAKDAEIRKQQELIEKERVEKEELSVLNAKLVKENEELSSKIQDFPGPEMQITVAGDSLKSLEENPEPPVAVIPDGDPISLRRQREMWGRAEIRNKVESVGRERTEEEKLSELNGKFIQEPFTPIEREVRQYTEDLAKRKVASLKQQQAAIEDKKKAGVSINQTDGRAQTLDALNEQFKATVAKDFDKQELPQQKDESPRFDGSNVNTAGLNYIPESTKQSGAPLSAVSGKNSEAFYWFNPGADKAAAAEHSLRGFRHYQAGNPALSLQDFARRPLPVPPPLITDEGLDEDEFIQRHGTRPFVDAQRDKLSTFAMDVDTSSYTRTRATLNAGKLPEPETVRVEEFVNYFKQPYSVAGDDAFGVFAEGGPSVFGASNDLELLKIGIKSRDPRPDERKPAVLTFVIDSSGSMGKGNRLDLVQHALKSLVNSLRPEDAVCIVAFGEQGELVLPRTLARQKQHILDAIETLAPRGGTNVESGLSLGYRMADEAYSAEAVNRIILCSDGVANVGAKGPDEILKRVKVFAARGIDLCTVGFGMGQYNDQMMQKLANNGNGSSYFVDDFNEAERVFREQLPPNLDVLARDAKVQVEFNPEVIERYRLLGYEKRKIADKDFRNDKIDAGEVGHSTLVTALYEIKRRPHGHGALGKVYLRWKDAGYRHLPVVERNFPLPEGIIAGSVSQTNPELRFLACIAEFAELLRESRWARDGSYTAVLQQLNQMPPSIRSKPEWSEVAGLVAQAQKLSMQKWLNEAGTR